MRDYELPNVEREAGARADKAEQDAIKQIKAQAEAQRVEAKKLPDRIREAATAEAEQIDMQIAAEQDRLKAIRVRLSKLRDVLSGRKP